MFSRLIRRLEHHFHVIVVGYPKNIIAARTQDTLAHMCRALEQIEKVIESRDLHAIIGLSLGSYMASALSEYSDRFILITSSDTFGNFMGHSKKIHASGMIPSDFRRFDPLFKLKNKSLWLALGKKDITIPYEDGLRLAKKHPNVHLEEHMGNHNMVLFWYLWGSGVSVIEKILREEKSF